MLAGCRHKRTAANAPPPPPLQQPESQSPGQVPYSESPSQSQTQPQTKPSPYGRKVLYSEVGIASWYGEPYHHSHAANGQIYRQDDMTAANRTLPLGTVIRVTNLTTRQSVVVTVTDRGPFVPGRMLDLSRGAANKSGLRRMGVARVRMDVLQAPKPLDTGGRWCVQIGVFTHGHAAVKLRDHLQRQYPTANVIEFTGSTGHWVRIKPQGETRRTAVYIAQNLRPSEGQAYLVRLD
jgi:rare lipoprotein A